MFYGVKWVDAIGQEFVTVFATIQGAGQFEKLMKGELEQETKKDDFTAKEVALNCYLAKENREDVRVVNEVPYWMTDSATPPPMEYIPHEPENEVEIPTSFEKVQPKTLLKPRIKEDV